jgi:hypothetical protein
MGHNEGHEGCTLTAPLHIWGLGDQSIARLASTRRTPWPMELRVSVRLFLHFPPFFYISFPYFLAFPPFSNGIRPAVRLAFRRPRFHHGLMAIASFFIFSHI